MNENMLTGESTPVIKSELPDSDEVYTPSLDAKYTLYCGTEVL